MNTIRQLSVQQLSVLNALLHLRSVSQAAQELQVSQPTVSFSLKKLRKLLGDELFFRTPEGMQPTPRALALAAPVQAILDTISAEFQAAQKFDPRTSRRTFSIALSDIGELVFLPPLLERLRAAAPLTDVRCVSLPPRRLMMGMEAGEIDLAIGYFPDLQGSAFYQQRLFDHPFMCIVRANHPRIRESLTLKLFLEAEHAVVAYEGRSQELFEIVVQRTRMRRQVRLRSPHFMSLPSIIANSDLISIVPRAVGAPWLHPGGLRMLKPPVAVPNIPLKQFWHRRSRADSAIIWLRKLVHHLFHDRDPTDDPQSAIFRSTTP